MTTELRGKVGIVTGGTSGIGRDAAVLFAKAGVKVVVAGRREAEGKETIDLIRAGGGDGLFVKTDVSLAADVQALVRTTVEKFGRLDIAFNNAGIEGALIPIADQSEEDWDRTIDINLMALPEVRNSADAQARWWRSHRKHGVRSGADWFLWVRNLLREQARGDGADQIRRPRNRA
jgi:NAD(P)-dependent dehydrogenase (short-subunit alcohol dehydrogenase family)